MNNELKYDSKERPPTPPERCPECGATENLTVAVECVPDPEATWGGRVVWDNDSQANVNAGLPGR